MNRVTKHLPTVGLLAGFALVAPRTGAAQETQTGDSTVQAQPGDTGEVQNPPGYRGMERPVNVFPPDSGSADSAGRVEDRATGTHDDSTWQDTTQGRQNPAGYRGMERPVGADTGAADTGAADTGAADTSRIDPTDTVGTGAAAPAAGDTAMAGRDSASVLPGDSASIQPSTPSRRLNPTDSAGAESTPQGP
jgi:hypothetical protein